MSIDGLTISVLTKELQSLLDSKIEKIYQPSNDSITLLLHSIRGRVRLYMSSNAQDPRIHIMGSNRQNPEKAPNFCMLLRKHLSGGKIRSISQTGFDRVVTLTIENKDELSVTRNLSLILEMMGRHSNIILADENGKILDSIKHVSIDTSSRRQILPGAQYWHISSGKLNPLTCSYEDYLSSHEPSSEPSQIFEGISRQYASELLFRNGAQFTEKGLLIEKSFEDIRKDISYIRENPSPCVQFNQDNVPVVYTLVPFSDYDISNRKTFSDANEMIDFFYTRKEEMEDFRKESQRLRKIVQKNLTHVQKKMKIHLEDISSKDKIDKYLLYGELLSANIYLLKRGQSEAELLNYYTNENIVIPMDSKLSPSSNVNSYFRRAQKLKTAARLSKEKYDEEKQEAEFLESLIYDIDSANSAKDLKDIRDILVSYKYIEEKVKKKTDRSDPLANPIEFETSSGKKVLIGRNSRQNDVLTLRVASDNDFWFHIKDNPGSHVLLFTEGKEPDEQDIYECAVMAAKHSKQYNLPKVSIDYTKRQNVWKEKGARAGMVLYKNYRTIVVDPAGLKE